MNLALTLTAGPLSATLPHDVTQDKATQMLDWFLDGWAGEMPEGLTVAQQAQWKLDQAHRRIEDYFVAEARRNRARALREAAASIEEQAEADTTLP